MKAAQLAFDLDKSSREQAFDCAKDAYRVYVLRGDPIKYTMGTYMGGSNGNYEFSTGGYLWQGDIRTKIPKGKVGIQLNSDNSIHIFSLREIYNAILEEAQL